MGKIWIIVQREYITRVKRKSFLITTLLAPLGFLLLITSSVVISTFSQGKTNVAVIDETGVFKEIPLADAEDQSVYFYKVDDDYETLATKLPKQKDAKYDAIILIPRNFDFSNPNSAPIACRSTKRLGMAKQDFIKQRIGEAYQQARMKMLNISEAQINDMQQKVNLNFESLGNSTENEGYTTAAAGVGMIMGFAIYISLFFYGTMIMKGVMEEKSNRIVEVLTSSVKPFQLLMGKIVGIGAVGLTQFILWIILMAVIQIVALPILGITMAQHSAMGQMSAAEVDPDIAVNILNSIHQLPLMQIALLFPIYFLGGFLLYGSLFAAVGAAMGEDGDQQALMVPVTVPIIISIFIAINVINNPDSSLGFWGSIIPFTSPVVMSALLPFKPSWTQIALSITLLIGGFVLTTYMAARIYRVGILMYGKKVKFKEIARWIFSNK